jgi:hypothetical protein
MSNNFKNVDIDFLVIFCQSNIEARVIMESLASRKNNCWESSIKSLCKISKDCDFPEAKIKNCCKAFERANWGKIKRASKSQGKESRFKWEYSTIQISREVMKKLNN